MFKLNIFHARTYRLFRYVLHVFTALSLINLAGCGWQLRGYDQLKHKGFSPTKVSTSLNLQFVKRDPELLQTLHKLARTHSVEMISSSPVTLLVADNDIDKRHLAVTETGVAAQFQLTLRYTYSLDLTFDDKTQSTPPERFTISSRRSYDFDATQIVAKNQEEQALIAEMKTELATMMISHAKSFYITRIANTPTSNSTQKSPAFDAEN